MFKMRITALTSFLDEYKLYEKGKTYRVSRARGWYFIAHGWARKGGAK